jgi:excisionase family DNA binding protein
MRIVDLATHDSHYVTVAELAEYWAVSRHQIYKQIESGALRAVRLGVRLYRVPTKAALDFERRMSIAGTPPHEITGPSRHIASRTSLAAKLSTEARPQPVVRRFATE